MRDLKSFEEFVKEGVVKTGSFNESRVKDLIEESSDAYDSLMEIVEKVGVSDKNANTIIKDAYDVIMSLVRASMFSEGFSSSGAGAHEAEVAFLGKIGFSEEEIRFANQLRYFRNGIMYYGVVSEN